MPQRTKRKWKNIRTDTCLNPFNTSLHGNKRTGLRKVTEQQLRNWNISVTEENLNHKVCNACRKQQTSGNASANESCENQNVCIFSNIIIK